MSLATDIIRVIKLTETLTQALSTGDTDLCAELLPQRKEAMVRLGLTCRDASPTEIESCRDTLRELEDKDAALRRLSQESLDELGSDLARTTEARRARPSQQSLCVDRKV